MNDNESIEKLRTSKKPVPTSSMNLAKAIELGEYDPKFLSGFAEWHTLTKHSQFQYIRQALDNRRRHLIQQWAEINNVLDFSKRPHLAEALRNIETQLNTLREEKERLYFEYSKP